MNTTTTRQLSCHAVRWRSVLVIVSALLGTAAVGPLKAGGVALEVCDVANAEPLTYPKSVGGKNYVELSRAVRALERIRKKVEEWGVVTISAPIAVLDERAFYVPPNIKGPEELYEEARRDISASVKQAVETGIQNQLSAVATPGFITPGVPAVSAPAGSTAQTSTTSTTSVQTPQVATHDASGVQRDEFKEPHRLELKPATNTSVGLGAFAEPFAGLAELDSPKKSVSASLREAQDNTMRQNIYTQMSAPKGVPGHSEVIFCIVQVSCNPGWRTQQHYTADVSANLEYANVCDGDYVPRGANRAPTVFSVLPLIDAQTIDMANSQREVTQLAFQLAASLPVKGFAVKARDLFEFVKRYSRDARSVTPIPVVNSYSTGSTFGFRFSPSFLAMKDPAQKKTRPANVLLPTTFPALVTVIVHHEHLSYAKRYLRTNKIGVLTHVHNRWQLKDREPLWKFPKRLFTPMKRDTVGMEVDLAGELATVYNAKDGYWDGMEEDYGRGWSPQYDELRRQLLALESKGLGRDWIVPLPPWKSGAATLFDQELKDKHRRQNKDMLDEANEARDAREQVLRNRLTKPVEDTTGSIDGTSVPKNRSLFPEAEASRATSFHSSEAPETPELLLFPGGEPVLLQAAELPRALKASGAAPAATRKASVKPSEPPPVAPRSRRLASAANAPRHR